MKNSIISRFCRANYEGITLLRTDRHGWIEITTDGEKLWVEVERR